MSHAAVEPFVGEAAVGHEPRSLTNRLGRIGVCIAKDTVEELAIAEVFVSLSRFLPLFIYFKKKMVEHSSIGSFCKNLRTK